MPGKLLIFPVSTSLDIHADTVLKEAIGELNEVVIVGTRKDGQEYFASSIADGPNVNWMLDRAKKALLDIADEEPL